MEFRTIVDIPKPNFQIAPCERMLFVGSCFADRMGKRFADEKFRTVVNPYGVMYNPVSIRHTIERLYAENEKPVFDTAVLTLGTNHVYVEKSTGEVVDNCQKRPANLFEERELTVEECTEELQKCCRLLKAANPHLRIILTLSPIRYAKYGYHGSQLSKATLLLAIESIYNSQFSYFPAYEIVNDELRDYRFYETDMLHPSEQAVEYIYERFADTFFSDDTKQFLKEWHPIEQVLQHKPFHPDSAAYRDLMDKTMLKVAELSKKYPNFAL